MSNEIKIGILTIIAIGLSVWGFNFIKGKNLFSQSTIYKVEYEDVTGLTKSAPVYLRGYRVGIVSDLYLNPNNPNTVIAEIDIDNDLNVPKNTTAALASGGLMSGQVIVLEFKDICDGVDCAQHGDMLNGRVVGMLESYLGVNPTTYVEQVKKDFPGVLDSLNDRIADPNNQAILAKTMRDVQQTTENLRLLTAKLDQMIGSTAGEFSHILSDMSSMTTNLEKSNGQVTQILNNTAQLTGKLAAVDINGTLGNVNGTLTKVDGTLTEAEKAMAQIKTSLNTADQALRDVNTLVTKINDGEGTVGYIMNDDKLAKDLELTLQKVSELSTNLMEKPYNIVPFKSRKRFYKNKAKDDAEGR